MSHETQFLEVLPVCSVSEHAAAHIKRIFLKEEGAIGMRLSVKKSGCSGYRYHLEAVKEEKEGEIVFFCQGFSLFIDPDSLPYIEGLSIDFKREGLNSRLTFENPNAKAICGCGESFAL